MLALLPRGGAALGAAFGIFCALSTPLRAEVLISEFLADNRGALDDEDGDSSDWIEIYNSGPTEVDLTGWYLTDDATDLTKWQLPATVLGVESFLVVFASEKDRAVAGQEYHTNFRLSASGDYLALVEADGVTVVSEYGPEYPRQEEDFSYGRQQTGNRTTTTAIRAGANCTWLVPSSEIGIAWTEVDFDDSAWDTAATGIGYETSSGYETLFGAGGDVEEAMDGVNTTIYVRLPFELSDTAGIASVTLRMKYDDGFIAYLNGVRVAEGNAPASPTFRSQGSADNSDDSARLFEDFDLSAFASELAVGANVLAIHGLNGDLDSSDMLIVPELDIERLTDPSIGGVGYLSNPSPGTFNGDTFEGFVADTQFSVDRGFYDAPVRVEITTLTDGATIRYTTDGSDPTETHERTSIPRAVGRSDSNDDVAGASPTRAGQVPTNIDTQTYLFLDDVIRAAAGRPGAVGLAGRQRGERPGHELRDGPGHCRCGRHSEAEVIEALRDIPSISIVTPIAKPGLRVDRHLRQRRGRRPHAGSGRRRSNC